MVDEVTASRAVDQRSAGRLAYPALLIVGAALIGALVVLCFTPRFVLWRGLDAHAGWFTPQLNRAAQTLRQLEDPWAPIDHDVNGVIAWRLFFPLLAHYLGMPGPLYLLLPAVGCLIALALLLHVFWKGTGPLLHAAAAAALMATTSWFFTSTGWLAYFDAWYVAALVLAAFVDARLALAASCLVAPWVDERFLLGLPLVLLVRVLRRAQRGADSRRERLADVLVCAGALLPLFAIRAAAMVAGDAGSIGYIQRYLVGQDHFPDEPITFLIGSWHGLRAVWFYVGALVVLTASRDRPLRTATIVVTVLGTILLALFTAADISRSMSLLLPAAVLGVLLVAQRAPRLALPLVTGLLAVNLAAPAAHVTTYFEEPIGTVFDELERAANPPEFLDPQVQNRWGIEYFSAGQLAEAFEAFDAAVRLDPSFGEAFHNRGRVAQEAGDLPLAREDFRRALALMPDDSPLRAYSEARLREVSAALEAVPAPPAE